MKKKNLVHESINYLLFKVSVTLVTDTGKYNT